MEVLEKAIADARTRRGWTAPKPVVAEIDGDDDRLYDQDHWERTRRPKQAPRLAGTNPGSTGKFIRATCG